MASRYCTYCGTSNPATAGFCMSCGAPLQGAPGGAPGPTGPLAPGPISSGGPYGGGPMGYPAPPAPPRRRHRWLLIIGVVVVAVLLVGGLLVFFLPVDSVQVTGINYLSPDNSCGWGDWTDTGFNVSPGESYPLEYTGITGNTTPDGGTAACVIHSATSTTSGFSVTNASVPLVVPLNASEIFDFTINTPSSNFDGPITIVIL